ncbi:MAG: CoA ester lyase [Anaerolineae bacterium]|nr:MAG: CoA ester lyase [Anaerolineae bacterium]
MPARRALLYMPGDDMHKIRKGAALGVDCMCMDLEDGVALNRKQAARQTVAEALQTLDFGSTEYLVRINPVGSGLEEDDLAAVLPHRPMGIVVPKAESGEALRWVSARIAEAEGRYGWPAGAIRLIAIVETALGVVNLREIAAADARLDALVFGSEDFAGSVGAVRTPEAWEVFYARSAVVTHAAAFGRQAIDMVCADFRDLERVRREAEEGARLGFTGKQIIHPAQIAPVQQAFTPTDEAIAAARRLVEAFEAHQARGTGAFAVDGAMVDAPMIKAAQQILARARAAGKI